MIPITTIITGPVSARCVTGGAYPWVAATSAPRWQTLEEALPVYGEDVCVQRQGTRFTACCRMRKGSMIWRVRAPLGAGSICRARRTDRWHPWPAMPTGQAKS